MRIPFNLPYVFGPGSDPVDNAHALRTLLECLIALDIAYLRRHPTAPLYGSGVVYGRTQVWEPIPALYKRGYGDCKSLTAAKIAQLRLAGKKCRPVFRFVTRPDGGTDYHILVQTARGFTDPSKVLGMGKDEVRKFYGPASYGDDLDIDPSLLY